MLFNSFEFLGFLPLTVIIFFAIGRHSTVWAMRWLILASLSFYGWWRPLNIAIIAPSVLVNYALARVMAGWADEPDLRRRVNLTLYLGVGFNLCFFGYFKYRNFFIGTINDLVDTHFITEDLILPLGISFITFQKIAFLFDVRGRRVKSFDFQDYCTFVFFFPQLIAGPIVHYNELMPQFKKRGYRPDWNDLALGLTLFCMGLFKKLVLADSIAPYLSGFYAAAAQGQRVALLQAWLAGIGFTLQIYFDFSAYSDMAIGVARLFGIRLPPNFDSPLKATSIIDFWTRWHMTLTRFLTAYLYTPLALAMTRRRAARGRPGLAGRRTTVAAFVIVLMWPLVITMSCAGLWHGAGWNFVIFGALHGLYLTVNHGWRLFRPRFPAAWLKHSYLLKPFCWLATFGCLIFANIFFRSSSVAAAFDLLQGMAGLNGVTVPSFVLDHLGPLGGGLKIAPRWDGADFVTMLFLVALLSLIAFIPPNTLRMLEKHEPALGFGGSSADAGTGVLSWRPSLSWAVGIALMLGVALINLPRPVSFVYFNF